MDLTLLQPGVTVVLGAERMPMEAALASLAADQVIVGVVSRRALLPPSVTRLRAPTSPDAMSGWLAAQGGPAVVVVDGVDLVTGDLAGEPPDEQLARLVREVRPQGAQAVVILQASAIAAGDTGPGPLYAADGAHVRYWDPKARRLYVQPPPPEGLEALSRPAWSLALVGALLACVGVALGFNLLGETNGVRLLGDVQRELATSLWATWLVDQQLDLGGSLNHTNLALWPVGLELIPLLGSLGGAVLSLPFFWVFGHPGWWNPFVFTGLITSGLAAAWLARTQGADRAGALLAGVAFATCPALIAGVGSGSPMVFWAAPLPLAVGLGLRALSGTKADATRAGLAFLAASLIWWFHAAFAAVIVLGAAALRLATSPGLRPLLRARMAHMGRIWLPSLLLAIPIWSADNQDTLSATGFLVLPGTEASSHLARLAFERAAQHSLRLEHLIPLMADSPTALLVSLLGPSLVVVWGAHHLGRHLLWPAILAVSATLALGPWLDPVFGLADGWLPLPLAFLEGIAPPLSHIAEPGRWLLLGGVAASVLVGRLATTMRTQVAPNRRRAALAALALALSVIPHVTGASRLPTLDWQPPAWARFLGTPGLMVEIPLGWSMSAPLWQPVHGSPTSGGPGEVAALRDATPYRQAWESVEPLPWFWRLQAAPLGDQAADRLRELRIRYVVVHQGAITELSGGAASERAWFLPVLAARIDNALGPPIMDLEGVRVYGVPTR
jgi:hypothetical protein